MYCCETSGPGIVVDAKWHAPPIQTTLKPFVAKIVPSGRGPLSRTMCLDTPQKSMSKGHDKELKASTWLHNSSNPYQIEFPQNILQQVWSTHTNTVTVPYGKDIPCWQCPPAGQCAMTNHTNCSGMAQRMWQRAQGVNLASQFYKSGSNQVSTEYVWSQWPHLPLTGLKGSTTNALVPDTTGKPSGVLCLCLDGSEPNPIHGRASMDLTCSGTSHRRAQFGWDLADLGTMPMSWLLGPIP